MSDVAAPAIPVIDIGPLVTDSTTVDDRQRVVANEIDHALQSSGFFFVSNHGVPQKLIDALWSVSRAFFALPTEEKLKIDMKFGGRAWRGFFPCGRELTSGVPDHKEGLYLGADLSPDHPAVKAGLPFHGENQYVPPGGYESPTFSCVERKLLLQCE